MDDSSTRSSTSSSTTLTALVIIIRYSDVLTRVQEANDILHELRSSSGISLNLVLLADVSQIAEADRRRELGDDGVSSPPGIAVSWAFVMLFSIIIDDLLFSALRGYATWG